MLPRTLEPEVMDDEQDAMEYDQMDHAAVNQTFVADLLAFAAISFQDFGSFGRSNHPWQEDVANDINSEKTPFSLGDVLDVGTGTALIPIELCRQHPHCRVMATDMATSMLNLAVYNVSVASMDSRITLNQVDAKKMVFPDEYFDVVISNSIIHHIPEPTEVFREMDRVLRPGGILFVRDLLRPANLSTLETLVLTYAGSETEYSRKLFSDSLHASLTLDEVRQRVGQFGYSSDSVSQTSDRHWNLAARKPIPTTP